MSIGLTARHKRAHLIRSLLEGVCYSERDCLDIIEELGSAVNSVRAVEPGETAVYRDGHAVYQALYPALKGALKW